MAGQWWDSEPEGARFKDTETGQILEIRKGRPVVLGSSQALEGLPSLTNADQKQVTDMQGDASQTESLASNANDFMKRNQRTGTGGIYAIPGVVDVAKALGVSGADDLAQMNRDNIASATQMRAPGMRLTQMEFGKFLGATPSTHNAGPQNAQVADQINKANALAQAKASFFTTYLAHKRSLDGAIPAWLNFRNQHFDQDGNFSKDPISDQQAAGHALKALSKQTNTPVTHGMTVDVLGRPVQ